MCVFSRVYRGKLILKKNLFENGFVCVYIYIYYFHLFFYSFYVSFYNSATVKYSRNSFILYCCVFIHIEQYKIQK